MRRISLGRVFSKGLEKTYYRLATDMGGPMRKLRLGTRSVPPLENISLRNFKGDKDRGEEILKGHFNYAGQHLDIGKQGDPWTIAAPSERFACWLHSFNWFWDLTIRGEKEAANRARTLTDRWIEVYGDWNSYTWDNDILANRLYAWLSNWSAVLGTDYNSAEAQTRRNSVYRQIKRLKQTYKRTPEGIPRLKAAVVIALAGLYYPDKTDEYLNRGLDWLDDQIDLQILPDGGHVSRSPYDCVLALELLTTLDQALEKQGVDGTPNMQRAIERLRHVIPFFQMPDGGLSSFNGSGANNKTLIERLLKFSPTESNPFSYCPHTGYQRIVQNNTTILVDTGETSPYPYDKEAHIAPLAFELSTDAGRMIVNCGWSPEQSQAWRDSMRMTAAHSTLTIDNQSAGSIVSSGLASKVLDEHVDYGINKVNAARKEQTEGVWLEMAHNGYQRTTGLSHRRRIYVNDIGDDIRGEDSLMVPIGANPISRDEIPFDIRFHLHPSVKATLAQDLHSALLIQPGNVGWRFRTDAGPMRIEESVYLAEGNRPVKTEQIVISGSAFADGDGESKSNRVRWSFRRLETKK